NARLFFAAAKLLLRGNEGLSRELRWGSHDFGRWLRELRRVSRVSGRTLRDLGRLADALTTLKILPPSLGVKGLLHYTPYSIGEPGPRGMPSSIHTTSMSVHPTRKYSEYGSMVETIVPIPTFLSYFCANAIITAKYVINGVMILVLESATR